MVQRSSLGCSVAQLVVHWPAVRQARVQILARHPGRFFPLSEEAMKKMREAAANEDGWLYSINVTMDECTDKDKMYKKGAIATKPLIILKITGVRKTLPEKQGYRRRPRCRNLRLCRRHRFPLRLNPDWECRTVAGRAAWPPRRRGVRRSGSPSPPTRTGSSPPLRPVPEARLMDPFRFLFER